MNNSSGTDAAERHPPEHPTLSTNFLSGVRRMDTDQWSRLVHTFGPIVYRWCRSSGVSETESPDVVQEVFASVARGIGKFERVKEQGSFRAWLATLTRSRVRDYYRQRAKQQAAVGGSDAMNALLQQAESIESTICADSIESPIIRATLDAVRVEFESTTWDAFWQTAVEGKLAADVAKQIGISVASVYQSKSRILKRLRKCLDDLG